MLQENHSTASTHSKGFKRIQKAITKHDFKSYEKLDGYGYSSVRHSVGEYVDKMAHINGIESFWADAQRSSQGRLSLIQQKAPESLCEQVCGAP